MDFFDFPYDWRPGATEVALDAAADQLAMLWPQAIRALYLQHDGAERFADDWEDAWSAKLGREWEEVEEADLFPQAPFLQPLSEVVSFYEQTKDIFPAHLRFFWTDHQSNYVGVYVAGPLTGMVCVLSHDDPDFVPVFRDVKTFLAWVCAHPSDDIFHADDRASVFPAVAPDPLHDAGDWQRSQELMPPGDPSMLPDSPELHCALSLVPYGQSEHLLPFLQHPDFYVVARAVKILTVRRFAPAHAAIERLSRDTRNTSNGAAQWAMRVWRLR